jgi:hypothetical protein
MLTEAPGTPGAFVMSGGDPVPDLDMNALLSATEAAGFARVSVNVIVNWRNRGWLPVATDPETGREIRDSRGRPRYRLLAVAKAEARTHQRAQKMASTITRRGADSLAA